MTNKPKIRTDNRPREQFGYQPEAAVPLPRNPQPPKSDTVVQSPKPSTTAK
jgi:hypothetical protein